MAGILIVEDDRLIATSLARSLDAAGHRAVIEPTVAGAQRRLADADLVLCDLGLPDGDGLDLIAHIVRQHPGLPIIVLTARAEEGDVLAGLDAGAVDYVTKPFPLAELHARVAAQLRQAAALGAVGPPRARLVVGDLELDLAARCATLRGVEVALRPKELDLLACLAQAGGDVVPRAELMRKVWGRDWSGPTKTLDVHVNALRRKLDDPSSGTSLIVTVRGSGYRLAS